MTDNRSYALDLKSPLERGDRLRWGVCTLKRVSNCASFTKLELVYLPQFRGRGTLDGQRGFYELTAVFARKAVLKVTGLHQQTSIIRSISFYPVLLTRTSQPALMNRSCVSPQSHSCASQCSLGRLYINGRLKMESPREGRGYGNRRIP
jgi:hypothetical protein